jgi:hypothetical protein
MAGEASGGGGGLDAEAGAAGERCDDLLFHTECLFPSKAGFFTKKKVIRSTLFNIYNSIFLRCSLKPCFSFHFCRPQ